MIYSLYTTQIPKVTTSESSVTSSPKKYGQKIVATNKFQK